MSAATVERREHTAAPILFIRRQVSRAQLPAAIGECLAAVLAHAQKRGVAIVGPPFTRYPSAGPGEVTAEIGFKVATLVAGEGEIEAGTLAGGPVAFAVHKGPYEELGAAYAALERFIASQGGRPGGAPWEVYVTDPGELPNPADWITEVYWPIA